MDRPADGSGQYDEAHGLTVRASGALTSGLDKLTEVLTPPPPQTGAGTRRSTASRGGRGGSRTSRRSGNHSRSWAFGDNSTKSTYGFGAAAAALRRRGGDDGAGGWPSSRNGFVNQESARSWLDGAWGEEVGGGSGSGRQAGRTETEKEGWSGTQTPFSRPSGAPSPSSWRFVWGDDDDLEM